MYTISVKHYNVICDKGKRKSGQSCVFFFHEVAWYIFLLKQNLTCCRRPLDLQCKHINHIKFEEAMISSSGVPGRTNLQRSRSLCEGQMTNLLITLMLHT